MAQPDAVGLRVWGSVMDRQGQIHRLEEEGGGGKAGAGGCSLTPPPKAPVQNSDPHSLET